MDYCSLAITRSMGMGERLRDALRENAATGEAFAERLGAFTVKISGCPNSCGQHHIGDIGLTGHTIAVDGAGERPFYSILVGGSVGETTGRVGKRLGRFLEEDTPKAIAALVRLYEAERTPGERFPAFVDRVGLARLGDVASAVARRA
jgi:sulfite reductase beta subunit-like hemoprotein